MIRIITTFMLSVLLITGYAQVNSVGIIGTATAGGWDSDTPMLQDDTDPNKWTLTVTLNNGEAKFRANGAWDINWGDTAFPIGTGTQGGSNIPVTAGTYDITFNSETGAYFFDLESDIGIIGSATPFGWDREVFMFRNPEDTNSYSVTLNLVQGEAKFRANGGWDINWGDTAFPEGTGTQGGPNIPVPQAGKYAITFNKATGAYNFAEQIDFTSIGIIGSATAGGWDTETAIFRDSGNPNLWKGTVALTEGELKFRANDAWTINWGGSGFPTGTAVPNGDNIAVTAAGNYLVSFNTSTLEYSFLVIGNYSTVGLIGDATPGGWDTDSPMNQDAGDQSVWKLRVTLGNGEAKFRANNDWGVNWGGGTFPSGVATQDGPNIPVVAGEYRVTFNSTTGEYAFEEVLEYRSVSIVGKSGPFNAWPETDDMGARDVFMVKGVEDPQEWTLTSVTLRNYADDTDAGIKFRADTAWTVNWGAVDFPNGTGTQNGPNIQPVAGTYGVVFNSASGEYAFGPVVSRVEDLLRPSDVTLAPNPARERVMVQINTELLGQELNLVVFDRAGRQVMQQRVDRSAGISLDVSRLQPGTYVISISDGRYMVARQLVVVQ
jgi:hypothetical protein